MDSITIEDLLKVDIRIGKIIFCEKVEGSEKLLKLQVDFGTEKRQILSGIAKWYQPEVLVGKLLPFILNLEPRKMMGLESQGMLFAVDGDSKPVLLVPEEEVPSGSIVK